MTTQALSPVLPAGLLSIDQISEELYWRAECLDRGNRVRLVEIVGEHAGVLREITHWYAAGLDIWKLAELTTRMSAEAREVLTLAGVHILPVPSPRPPFGEKRRGVPLINGR